MHQISMPVIRHGGAWRMVPYLATLVAGVLFGAVDQYVGSVRSAPLTATLSLMSAPWLLLPFVVGCTQRRAWRATAMGTMVTVAAVLGYAVMIMSPVEGVHGPIARVVGAVFSSQARWFIAALFAGPSYGLLGQRWRTTRSLISALLATIPLLVEPAARLFYLESGQPTGYLIELAVGVLAAGYFGLQIARSRRLTAPPAKHGPGPSHRSVRASL